VSQPVLSTRAPERKLTVIPSLHRRPRNAPTPIILFLLALAFLPAAESPRKSGDEPENRGGSPGKRPLADLVKDHEKLEGILTLYRSPEHLYADIPDSLLGKPLGLSGIRVKALGDWSTRGEGIATHVVTFSRVGNRIQLAKKNLDYQADSSSSLRLAVDSTFPDSPVFLSNVIETAEKRASTLVDLAGLFSPDLIEILPPSSGYSVSREDASIATLRVHPDDLVVRVVYRFRQREESQRGAGAGEEADRPNLTLTPRLPDPRFLEAVVDYTLFRLPQDGFRPREADERIGGFDIGYKDYTNVSSRDSAFRHRFDRWKLEKRDAGAGVSPARDPITFYIDRATPPEWRPGIREAAAWWNRSFEKIGIRDAVRVLDQPEDPNWDPTDIHHSMVYWNLSDNLIFSGMAGPMVTDPRTGQILKANVYLNGEFPSYTLHRYLVYAWWRAPQADSTADPFLLPATGGARGLSRLEGPGDSAFPGRCDREASFSSQIAFARLVLEARGVLGLGGEEADRFAREAFAELVAHEVGHALGFSHNFKGSLLSDPADLAEGRATGDPNDHPFTGSIMDYDPINLAPQGKPEGDYFMRGVGPYDDLLLDYLYRPLAGATPEEERRELARIAQRAETTPGLMFDDGPLSAIDPNSSTDDLGSDPLGFAESRLTMIQQEVLPRIAELVVKEGHDYNVVRQALDAAIFSVALDYIDIVARFVGGQDVRRIVAEPSAAPRGAPVAPLNPGLQRRALTVLDRLVFDPNSFPASPRLLALLKSDLLLDWNYPYRFASDYSFDNRVAFLYDSALSTLLEPRRLARIQDNERRTETGVPPLTLPELFGHLESTALTGMEKAGLTPAGGGAQVIPARRRSLQRLLVSRLSTLTLAPPRGTPAEATQVARSTLREIRARVRRVIGSPQRLSALDGYSRAHLEDLDAGITRALEARVDLKPAP